MTERMPGDDTRIGTDSRGAGTTSTEARPTTGQHVGARSYERDTGAQDSHLRDYSGHEFAARKDRVRWGPVWAGVLVTVSSFLLMQLAIFAGGLFDEGGNAGTWLTAAAALVAFLLGGLVAGATAMWHSSSDGLINGIVMWALAVVSLLFLAIFGGGTLLGPISTVASDLVQVQDLGLQDVPAGQIDSALEGTREAAGWSLLGLALALAASAIGGMAGAKIWPSRDTADTTSLDAASTQTVDLR